MQNIILFCKEKSIINSIIEYKVNDNIHINKVEQINEFQKKYLKY
ncbi:hypothetical protein VAMP_178845n127 [Candidatus Vampirococcus lugosii]|uniref:Uncharacterized protein n=1 Tax=Candidatus Vampirococcus lugosii TaxID=2789015 RepID=A0ABS5QMW1_9BACT|nr:hypothetical protein [Candidatus Vampirococcus lugosii]